MPRRPREILECRDYMLAPEFPIVVLSGDVWRISDCRSPTLHFHTHMEIGVCHSDSGILEFRDAQYPFRAGDVTLISPNIPHTTYSSPGTASKWSYLMVDLVQMISPLAAVSGPPPEVLYKDILYNARMIVHQEQDPMLSTLIMEIIREVQGEAFNYRQCVRGLFDALISKFSRHALERVPVNAEKRMPIAPALQYIDTHYMDDFKMDQLAAVCMMSPSYFRKVFTETMELSPLEYLNQVRIMRACALLQVTDLSILDICESVGFGSLSSFNRHFSSMIGQSPTAWRNQVNEDRPVALRRYTGWLAPPKSASASEGSGSIKNSHMAVLGTAGTRRP